jgi:hypothetical protein
MFTAEDFRARAKHYTDRTKISADRGERRELQQLGQSSAWLANNLDWLTLSPTRIERLRLLEERRPLLLQACRV